MATAPLKSKGQSSFCVTLSVQIYIRITFTINRVFALLLLVFIKDTILIKF